MKEGIDITKIVGSSSLLLGSQAEKVISFLEEKEKYELDMNKVKHCTTGFVNYLIYNYNKSKNFDRTNKLIFFNVKNPIVAYKIQEAQFHFFDKKIAKKYIKFHDKILEEMINY